MKQKSILLATLSIPLLLLSACGGASKLGGLELGDNVINEGILKANIAENKNYKEPETIKYTTKQLTTTFTGYEVNNHYDYGCATVWNETTYKYGVYSYLAGKYLINARLEDSPDMYDDSVFGFRMRYYDTDDNYYIADGAGNVLYKSSSYLYNPNINYTVIDDTLYSTVEINGYSGYEILYFKYDAKGKATKIDALPSSSTYTPTDVTPAGEIFRTKTYNFEKLGLDRYLTAYSSTYIVLYNKDNSLVKEYSIPSGATGFVVGKKFIYQVRTDVGINAKEYDYAYNGSYYKIKTTIVNLETLEEKEEKIGVVFSGGQTMLDENKAPKYSVVSVSVINNGALEPTKTYVMTDDLVLHDDVTGKFLSSGGIILQNGNIYFSYDHVLVDKDCKPVSSFSSVSSLSFNSANETFIGTLYHSDESGSHNSFFYCNNEGKMLVPTKTYSSSSYSLLSNGYLKLKRLTDDKDVLYDTRNSKEIEMTKEQSLSGDFLISAKNTSKTTTPAYTISYTVVGEDKALKTFTNAIGGPSNVATISRYFYNTQFKIINVSLSAGTQYHMFANGTFTANAISAPTAA